MKEFPLIQTNQADAERIAELAGALSLFTVPVLLLFIDGKEALREARFVHLEEFKRKIGKMYEAFFFG
jgi:hypothetical protein